jgi:hypothetical protein
MVGTTIAKICSFDVENASEALQDLSGKGEQFQQRVAS